MELLMARYRGKEGEGVARAHAKALELSRNEYSPVATGVSRSVVISGRAVSYVHVRVHASARKNNVYRLTGKFSDFAPGEIVIAFWPA